MDRDRIVFSGHALRRMFERKIGIDDVQSVPRRGEEIAGYPDDVPYPSCLVLGFVADRAVHVVADREESERTCYVITVYHPDPEIWESDFKRRRP